MFILIAAVAFCFYLISLFNNSDRKMLAVKEHTNTSQDVVPSVWIDQNVLQCTIKSNNEINKFFIIDNRIFEDQLRLPENNYEEFQMYAMKRSSLPENFSVRNMDSETNNCWTSDESSDEEEPSNEPTLDIQIQEVPSGLVINSNVYLTEYQWNTIVMDDEIAHCVVCDVYTNEDDVNDHMSSRQHFVKLNRYKPLAEFSVTITRKIRNIYHCAVCNATFDLTDVSAHDFSEEHANKLYYALNKVADLNDNRFHNNNDNNILGNQNNESDRGKENYYPYNKFYVSGSDSGDNEDNLDDDEDENNDVAKPGPSYSDALKKTALAQPEHITTVVFNTKVTVNFDCWHMLITPKPNRFYCMLCKDYGFISKKTKHCSSPEHMANLNKCKVVAKFEDHFIRQVDELFHCGHCNNLQLPADIQDHLEIHHPRKTRMLSESSSAYASIENNDQVWSDDDVAMPGPSYSNALKKPALPLPEHITTVVGNRNVTVNFDCWHMLTKPKPNRFYCMLCKDYGFISRRAKHCSSPKHTVNLNKCKVVAKFEDHFIRQVDELFHCGHCNSLQLPHDIEHHLERQHPRKTRILSESSSANAPIGNNNTDRINSNDTFTQNVVQPTVMPSNDQNTATGNERFKSDTRKSTNDKHGKGSNDHSFMGLHIVLNIFDWRLRVPLLSYHFMQEQSGQYYCGLCHYVYSAEKVVAHMQSEFHKKLMQLVPYAGQFTYNLIRAVHCKMHCTLCNIFLLSDLVHLHIQELSHRNQLHQALGFNKTEVIEAEKKVTNDKISTLGNESNDKSTILGNSNNDEQLNYENANNNNSKSKLRKHSDFGSANNDNESNFGNVYNDKKTNIGNRINDNQTRTSEIVDNDGMMVTEDLHNDSIESVLDIDSHVYVKMPKVYLKIHLLSHNTMIVIGDGNRYCFACSTKVNFEDFKKHIESRSHENNLKECKYIDLSEGNLLRQMHLLYHCGTCNVAMPRKTIKQHMAWPTHVEELDIAKNIPKNTRKTDIKNGTSLVVATLQKETIYLGEDLPKCKILFNVEVVKDVVRKHKIVMVKDDVLKVSFDNWHGISRAKTGKLTCVICQCDVEDLSVHTTTNVHLKRINNPFRQDCFSQLLRVTTKNTLHCIPCNVEVGNVKHIVSMHVSGKNHMKKYKALKESSAKPDSNYDDCEDVILQL